MLALSTPVWTQRCGKDSSRLPCQEYEELHVAFLQASCYTSREHGASIGYVDFFINLSPKRRSLNEPIPVFFSSQIPQSQNYKINLDISL